MRRRALLAASGASGSSWGQLFDFTIRSRAYSSNNCYTSAYEGMTWRDWVNSEFNKDIYGDKAGIVEWDTIEYISVLGNWGSQPYFVQTTRFDFVHPDDIIDPAADYNFDDEK